MMAYEHTSIANIEVTCLMRSISHCLRCSNDFPVSLSSPHKKARLTHLETIWQKGVQLPHPAHVKHLHPCKRPQHKFDTSVPVP